MICVGNAILSPRREMGGGYIMFVTGRGEHGDWLGLIIEDDGRCYHACLGLHQDIVTLLTRGTWVML